MHLIRVILADDHPALRAGVRDRLDREDDIHVVGETGDGEAALELAAAHRPHVLVLDLELPGISGLEVARRVRDRELPVRLLALSAYAEAEYITQAMQIGFSGYLTKQETLDTIVEAVRGVARGEDGWLSRQVASVLMKQSHSRRADSDDPADLLSEREREVLFGMAQGHSNQQIGEKLFISESTVKKHVNSIYSKLEMHTRSEVVAWAWRNDIFRDGRPS